MLIHPASSTTPKLTDDANHASEVAQQELAKRRTEYEAARSQREDGLRERQRAIQLQLRKRKQERELQQGKQRTGHDDTGKRRNEAVSEDEKEEEEDADEEDDDETGERLAASKVELEALRQCCRQIKDVMGIMEAHEVVAKLTQQTDTMENLLTISEENQARRNGRGGNLCGGPMPTQPLPIHQPNRPA